MTGWRSTDWEQPEADEDLPGAPNEGAWIFGIAVIAVMWLAVIGLVILAMARGLA